MTSTRLIIRRLVGVIVYLDDEPAAQGLADAEGAGRYYIHSVVVRREHRGKGIGEFLMRVLLSHLVGTYRAQEVFLDVKDDNIRALHLFQKVGFRKARVMHRMCYGEDLDRTDY